MTQEEINTLSKKQMDKALSRLPILFGANGNKIAKCENKCGGEIRIKSFNVFMFPESEKFKVLFVYLQCCKQLYITHNMQNKN